MRGKTWAASAFAVAAVCLGPAAAGGQTGDGVRVRSRAIEITISGRIHQQFNTTSVDGEAGSEFLIRRARPEFEVVINDWISGKLSADFGEGDAELRDAYVRLDFDPAFEVTLGQFKRPFDLFELTSSTQILVIERAGKIRGLDDFVGGADVYSLSRFTERLRYSDRDIGVQVAGRDRTGRIHWAAALTNGNGANAEDVDGRKAYQLRLGVTPAEKLTVSGGVSGTPYRVEPGATGEHDQAVAFQLDAEYGDFDRGPHVQAGIVTGDNWRPVEGTRADPPRFVAWQVIGTYKFEVEGNRWVRFVEPVFRVSQGDPDTDVRDDAGVLVTPGVVLHFVGRNKFALNYDVWVPQSRARSTESSFKAQVYLHF